MFVNIDYIMTKKQSQEEILHPCEIIVQILPKTPNNTFKLQLNQTKLAINGMAKAKYDKKNILKNTII